MTKKAELEEVDSVAGANTLGEMKTFTSAGIIES